MWATARRGWGVLALALVAMAAAGVGADTAVEIGHSGERDNFPADVLGMRDGGGSLLQAPNVTVPPPIVPPRPLPPMPPIPRMPPPTLTPGMPPPEAPESPPTPTPPDAPSPPEKAPPSPPLPEPPDAPDAPTPPTSNASTWPTRCSPRRVPRADRCEFVRKTHSCQSEHHLVPYLTMHYCWTDGGVWSAVSQALVIASLFYILATVAERFFCPALENIAAALRIPEDVAGATLLSFGNGAPDCFAQIAALSRDDPEAVREGISLALGANLGAGIFISAAVFPIVVLITPSRYARHRHPMDIEDDRRSNEIQSFDEEDGDESDANAPLLPDGSRRPDPGLWKRFDAWTRRGGVEVERGPFIRDVCFYACAVGGVSLAMTKGSVNRTEAAALVGAYLVYLSVLLVPSRVSALVRHMTRVGVESDELMWENDHTERRLTQGLLDEDDEIDDYAALIEDGAPGMLVPNTTTQVADEEYPGEYPGTVNRGDAPSGRLSAQGAEEGADTAVVDERTRVSSMTHPDVMTASFLSDGGFTARRGLRKVTGMLTAAAEAPVVSLIRCTMPDLGSDPARRSRVCTSLLPVTAPLFFVFVERFLGVNKLITPAGAVYGAVCGVMGACAMYVAWPHVKYSRVMHGVLTCVAFVMSVTWMDATAGELVSLLTALGKIHGVSETLLGATVLAWGNSVGDIVADVTIAREGHPAMAIAACFAGPLFNLLMGLSAGLAIATETHGNITGIHLENELVVLAGALLVSLAFQAIATPLMHRWRFSRGMAIASLSYYVVFSVVYALISVGVLFPEDWF